MLDQNSISTRLGVRLREARLQTGRTVREVADRVGLKLSVIVKYENGAIVPSIERLQALAQLYDLTIAALLAERDEAIALFALLDQADIQQIEQLATIIRERLRP